MKPILLTFLSASIDSVGRRIMKVWNGKSDTRTARQYGPYGIDSNPIKNRVALFTHTQLDGADAILGVANFDNQADPGETRLFATDEAGTFKFNIWMKADGTVLIGDNKVPASFTNFAVKYNESNAEIGKLKATVDDLVTKWNAFASVYVPGSPSVTGLPATLATSNVTPNTSNFTLMKNDKVKFN